MFRITNFQELMKGLPRGSFDAIVNKHNANKYTKQFGYWQHVVAMIYAQLSGASSLRELQAGFNGHVAHHYHLGASVIKKSTLADANSQRKDAVFVDVVQLLMQKASRSVRQQSQEWLCLLDSTPIFLKGREFDRWTEESKTRHTQGLKLHVLYDTKAEVPTWHSITAPNVNDVTKAWDVPLHKGAIYVFDKGYCDYGWWREIDLAEAQFVTRFKCNAGVSIERELPIEEADKGMVISDQIVRFKHKHTRAKCKLHYERPLRRVMVMREDKATPLVFATNDLTSSAREIAQRYKERWGIELFFKWIKQHLKIKSFFGRSENAVRIQLLTALIAYLLVALHKQTHQLKATLWECLCLIRATLFQRKELDDHRERKRRREEQRMNQFQIGLFT
jgi:IS4 transposase